jgi:hypothetical protein
MVDLVALAFLKGRDYANVKHLVEKPSQMSIELRPIRSAQPAIVQ